jgi:hypothetical protein
VVEEEKGRYLEVTFCGSERSSSKKRDKHQTQLWANGGGAADL